MHLNTLRKDRSKHFLDVLLDYLRLCQFILTVKNKSVKLPFETNKCYMYPQQNKKFDWLFMVDNGCVFTTTIVSLNIPEGVLFTDFLKQLKKDRCFHELN